MTLREAVREAYVFGSGHPNTFTFVVRRSDGSHYRDSAESRQVLAPESVGEIVWRREFTRAFDVGEPTEAEWEEWLDVNTTTLD